jgi:hypothetical protein
MHAFTNYCLYYYISKYVYMQTLSIIHDYMNHVKVRREEHFRRWRILAREFQLQQTWPNDRCEPPSTHIPYALRQYSQTSADQIRSHPEPYHRWCVLVRWRIRKSLQGKENEGRFFLIKTSKKKRDTPSTMPSKRKADTMTPGFCSAIVQNSWTWLAPVGYR